MASDKYRVLTNCRVCGGKKLQQYLDLGKMPLANNLITKNEIAAEEKFPLQVLYCSGCSFSQLSIIVNPDIMFRNYVYRSSISKFFQNHCKEWASELNEKLLTKDDLVIDIASNDGCLLQEFKREGNRVLGIDPAINLAKIANEQGIETLPQYWNPKLAEKIVEKYGKAKAIIAVNVFAHIDDLHSMVEGVNVALADGGYFMIESPHLLSLIKKTEFDTIYHEHLSYLMVGPLQKLMEGHKMRIAKVKKYDIHGGSIRMYVEKESSPNTSDGSVQQIIREEKDAGLYEFSNYINFKNDVEKIKKDLTTLLKKLKKEGKTIAAFGASAKGNTLLNYCNITTQIDCIFDDTPQKIGKLYPGVHIPIVAGSELLKRKPDYLLLLAWNFAKEIMQKTSEYKKAGGKYIIPIPKVEVVEK
ncbi:MAG TPA: class I SAM-dependent methyltransferase [archaeon]|nr:class I SAM-dependent methyltransferase [archaeon]